MHTKPVLAFDTATTGASIALLVNGTLRTHTIAQTSQAADLVPAIDTLLNDAAISYRDLGAIITTIGPGSFTGVRIGLAALHGFVLVNQTPIMTITTLEAMAWQVANRPDAPSAFHIALRAGKGELYAQQFSLADNNKPHAITDITLYPEEKIDWDAPCFGNHLPAEDIRFIAGPNAALLCTIADQLPTSSLAEAMPLYIRPPDAIIGAPHAWLTAN